MQVIRQPGQSAHSAHSYLVESVGTGVAYASALCVAGAFLVASFRPNDLADPYWSELRGVRTDTTGAVCFVILALALVVSEFLRLRRRRRQELAPWSVPIWRPAEPFTTAVAEVVALLSTGLVLYLSVNAVTHPATLHIQATHFATWPTEGTLRVVALLIGGCSVAWLRFVAVRTSGDELHRPTQTTDFAGPDGHNHGDAASGTVNTPQ